jgi:uncharacterized membrane protein YfcA
LSGSSTINTEVDVIVPLASSRWMQAMFINHLLRILPATGSQCYLALFRQETTPPSNPGLPPFPMPPGSGGGITGGDSGGGGGTPYVPQPIEVSGSNYARIFVTGSFTITNASAVNTWDIYFNTAASDWGKITHFGLLNGTSASNSGSILYYGPLSASRNIYEGDTVSFLANDIKILLSGAIPYASGSRMLNAYLNNVPYVVAASSISLALYSVLPSASGWGGTELTGTGYSRKVVGGSGSWLAPDLAGTSTANIFTSNASAVVFANTSNGDWGTVTGFCIWDTFTSRLIYRGQVFPQVTVLNLDGIMFNRGDLKIIPDTGRSQTQGG